MLLLAVCIILALILPSDSLSVHSVKKSSTTLAIQQRHLHHAAAPLELSSATSIASSASSRKNTWLYSAMSSSASCLPRTRKNTWMSRLFGSRSMYFQPEHSKRKTQEVFLAFFALVGSFQKRITKTLSLIIPEHQNGKVLKLKKVLVDKRAVHVPAVRQIMNNMNHAMDDLERMDEEYRPKVQKALTETCKSMKSLHGQWRMTEERDNIYGATFDDAVTLLDKKIQSMVSGSKGMCWKIVDASSSNLTPSVLDVELQIKRGCRSTSSNKDDLFYDLMTAPPPHLPEQEPSTLIYRGRAKSNSISGGVFLKKKFIEERIGSFVMTKKH